MAVDPSATMEVHGLTVAYGDAPAVIDGLDLMLRAGEIVGVSGAGGSGKSTLAWALLGLTRGSGAITGGSLRLAGQDLLAMSESERRRVRGRDIALVVQNPRGALHPMLRIGPQIERIATAHARSASATQLLQAVGVADASRRARGYAHELSGGMAQRALIAMALASGPRVLIADEPTSGLDVTVQAQFLDWMWRYVRERGGSLLLISQERGVLANYCDRVLHLTSGRLVAEEAPGAAPEALSVPLVPPARMSSYIGPVIARTDSLRKRFRLRESGSWLHAVNDVSLDMREGEALGLVGESGSGKTTVGRILVGLTDASDGHVEFDGQVLSGHSPSQWRSVRRRIQFLRQDPTDSFDPRWTLGRSLREPLDLHAKLPEAQVVPRLQALLALVDLDVGVLDRRPAELPAGSLQRLAIARALATDPALLVLDEPTSMLDPVGRSSLIALLARLRAERRLTMLFISHDLTTVARACDRVAVMYLGQIVEIGKTADVMSAPLHPYTRALMDAWLDPAPRIRRVDRPHDAQLSGEIPSPVELPKGCFLASRCPVSEPVCRIEPQSLRRTSDGRGVRCFKAPIEASE